MLISEQVQIVSLVDEIEADHANQDPDDLASIDNFFVQ